MQRIRILVFPLLLAVYGLAWGGFEEGLAAAKRGHYEVAFREWRPLAEQGNAKAQYNLGQLYRGGLGTPQNFKEAEKWYRMAAQQGVADAQYNLGVLHYEGVGVPQNYKEAKKWYLSAAQKGFVVAQYSLGIMYHNGDGVPQDPMQAYMWFSIASENGVEEATRSLAVVTAQLTPPQINHAQSLARVWMQKHPRRTGESE